jgi:hypothetical protein
MSKDDDDDVDSLQDADLESLTGDVDDMKLSLS